jgi:bifunctional non-homologous end joining protein LigD
MRCGVLCGWAHELRRDGYRLQIHVRDGRVRVHNQRRRLVETLPADVESAAEAPPFDAEVVWLDAWHTLHSRVNDSAATALAFDLLMHNGEDVRRRPFTDRKAMLRKVLQLPGAAFNTSNTPRVMARYGDMNDAQFAAERRKYGV